MFKLKSDFYNKNYIYLEQIFKKYFQNYSNFYPFQEQKTDNNYLITNPIIDLKYIFCSGKYYKASTNLKGIVKNEQRTNFEFCINNLSKNILLHWLFISGEGFEYFQDHNTNKRFFVLDLSHFTSEEQTIIKKKLKKLNYQERSKHSFPTYDFKKMFPKNKISKTLYISEEFFLSNNKGFAQTFGYI